MIVVAIGVIQTKGKSRLAPALLELILTSH